MKKRIFMVIMATAFGLFMNAQKKSITPYALAMKEKAMMQELQKLVEQEMPDVASTQFFTRVKTIENSISKMERQLAKVFTGTNKQSREWDNSYEPERKENFLKLKQWRIANEENFMLYIGPNVETTGFNLIPNDYHFLMIETLAEMSNDEKSMKRRNMDDWFYSNNRYNFLINALDLKAEDQLEIFQKNLQGKEEDEFLRFGEKIQKMLAKKIDQSSNKTCCNFCQKQCSQKK
jgi:hypothetical protein